MRASPALSPVRLALRAGTIVGLVVLGGCKPSNKFQPPPPQAVSVQKPVRQDVTEYLEDTGQLSAVRSVTLVARIEGILENIDYQDGAMVKQGANLFTIEPPPFKAQLDEAQANLASGQAKAAFAVIQKKRFSVLASTNDVPKMQAQQAEASSREAEAAVLQAQAALRTAGITYSYTHVVAPFKGVVSAHMQNVGALVGGSQATQLATITQLDPIWVNFNVSEQDVLRARTRMKANGRNAADLHDVAVEIRLQGEDGYPHRGHIDYTSPSVDPSSGTLAVRGVFSNSDTRLLLGYFVRVRIPIGTVNDAMLVPDTAIVIEQGGPTLLIVDEKGIVERRSVTTGPKQGSLRVVETGLQPNDRIIVNGLQRARVGAQVQARNAPPPAAATAKPKQG